ncbi:S1-like domain-containing RNA-binding protein [Haploplasma axanthum]|uniref:Conserved virulence factor B n=1 Tax=Haploplasma axanthum TaxID=29552 RepID=A0A449BDF3_HAPAX|nr:S1-like domain-containing RNA-binding protein [Haploplasma axanthum]VEU80476.1 Conserved virulence factor B [Haploplasma axanthum]
MPKIGNINELKVLRETDISFMLDSDEGEIFLHKNESNYQKLKAGNVVSAFLYYDQDGRLAATLKTPLITTSKPALLEVGDIVSKLGVFLRMGISKDLLLSKDDLPLNKKEWPQVGDKLFVKLNVKGRLVAKIVDLKEVERKETLAINDEKEFYVQRIGEQGLNLVSEDLEIIFVHNSMYRGNYHLGEKVVVKVIGESDKGYSGSLVKQKELLRFDDAEEIMNYLKRYKKLPLTSKSSSEEVNVYFDMSKKAFKRALGLLYKERKVDFTETETILIDGEKNER